MGAAALGLGLDRQLTRTGGLSFAGGPWNNYVMHAIATLAGELMADPGTLGLCWANGGYATKHAFGIYSTTPPPKGFRYDNPQDEINQLPTRELAADYEGPVTIEGYTVMHSREGVPEFAIAAGRVPDGRRAWATSNSEDDAAALCDGEWVGQAAEVDAAQILKIC
jgi:acetyl-CoA C-acetyltransferase